jgi:hypothetical protein
MTTASEYASLMAKHRETQPRPIKKLYGVNGPTPEQLTEYLARTKRWSAEYGRLSKLQKRTLANENAILREKASTIIKQLKPLLK